MGTPRAALLALALALAGCAVTLGSFTAEVTNQANIDLQVPAFGSLCIGCLQLDPNS